MSLVDRLVPQPLADSDLLAEAVSWRRHLHMNPEIAYREFKTADFVAEQLAQFGLQVHRGLGKTGVVGTLSRGQGRRAIAIRADMDALPVQEETGLPHCSRTSGVMHACGHDGHVAILLAAARKCADLKDLDGTVHFIFQPAEEGQAGARRMIEDGLLRLFPVDQIFALHNWPDLPLGSCWAPDGPIMAANAILQIVLNGRGTHGALPHRGTDLILAASTLVPMLHSIVGRDIDPTKSAALSVTMMEGGHNHNVLPASVRLKGTSRWYEDAVGDSIECRLRALAEAVATGFSATATIEFERRYPATINSPRSAGDVRKVIEALDAPLKLAEASPSLTSEDFSFMLKEVDGCYFWLGTGTDHAYAPLHSPAFDFNDSAIPLGVQLWTNLVRTKLGSQRD